MPPRQHNVGRDDFLSSKHALIAQLQHRLETAEVRVTAAQNQLNRMGPAALASHVELASDALDHALFARDAIAERLQKAREELASLETVDAPGSDVVRLEAVLEAATLKREAANRALKALLNRPLTEVTQAQRREAADRYTAACKAQHGVALRLESARRRVEMAEIDAELPRAGGL